MKGIVAYIFGLGLMVNAGYLFPRQLKLSKQRALKKYH